MPSLNTTLHSLESVLIGMGNFNLPLITHILAEIAQVVPTLCKKWNSLLVH